MNLVWQKGHSWSFSAGGRRGVVVSDDDIICRIVIGSEALTAANRLWRRSVACRQFDWIENQSSWLSCISKIEVAI